MTQRVTSHRHRPLTGLLTVLAVTVAASASLAASATPATAAPATAAPATAAPATATTTDTAALNSLTVTLRDAVDSLPVAAEDRTGYKRTLFKHWIDADGDGCNTRYEVLIDEAVTTPTVGSGCTLSGGLWYSYYDDEYWTEPADLDIDHFVPLAEAWDSGASEWTSTQRKSYANDLGDPRALVAVTDSVNQAKGDQDPATWMPSYGPAQCTYITEWVAVKLRWRLTVDTAESAELSSWAQTCPDTTITVTPAI